MRLRLAVLAALVIFWATVGWLAKEASAQTYLPVAVARTAISTYEQGYWKGQPVTVTILACQRHSAMQVSCLAEAHSEGLTVRTRDWATRIAHGDIRVHPGHFEAVAS